MEKRQARAAAAGDGSRAGRPAGGGWRRARWTLTRRRPWGRRRRHRRVTTAGTTETAAGSSRSSRKRPYPYEVGEEDREIDKMFKCNYWEDPAREGTLQRFGQLFARAAAVDVYCESSRRIVAAWLAGRAHLKLDDKET